MDGKACANEGSSWLDDLKAKEEFRDPMVPGRLNWMASVTLINPYNFFPLDIQY